MKNYYRKKSLEDNRKRIVSDETVEYIRSMRGIKRQVDLALEVGVTQGQICHIQKNKYHINIEE